MTHTNLTPPNNERCERCGCADYDRLRFVYRGPRVVMLCDGCLSAPEPSAPAQRLCPSCGEQPLVSPLHTRCTDCWEKDMLAALSRAMGEAASEAATHPRHDERMVLPALGPVRHRARVCSFCADPREPVVYSIRPQRALRPDGSLTPQEPSLYYCQECLGDLNELLQRATAVHPTRQPCGDWGRLFVHASMMASEAGRPTPSAYQRDGWRIELADLLRPYWLYCQAFAPGGNDDQSAA